MIVAVALRAAFFATVPNSSSAMGISPVRRTRTPGTLSIPSLVTVRVIASVAERPAIRWGEMKPIDFQGEDTSLTQEQLEVLR